VKPPFRLHLPVFLFLAICVALSTSRRQSNAENAETSTFWASVDFDFGDSKVGWSLIKTHIGDDRVRITLRRTVDGGASWSTVALPRSLEQAFAKAGLPARFVRFADARNGWIFGPQLFSTHDGGETWRREKMPGAVRSVAIADGTIWVALLGTGEEGVAKTSLLESSVARSAWSSLKGQPTVYPPTEPSGLFRVDLRRAWLLSQFYFVGKTDDSQKRFVATKDSGASWFPAANPCPSGSGGEKLPAFALMTVAGKRESLWLLCGWADSPTSEIAFVRSTDGGVSWEPEGTRLTTPMPRSFAASLEDQIWLAGGIRGGLVRSDDSGKTWSAPPSFADPDVQQGLSKVLFTDSLHGWVSYNGGVFDDGYERAWIFRTVDGGQTWTRFRMAP
jgi:photosystem II stability/assembly factor-like uncharacterized protein